MQAFVSPRFDSGARSERFNSGYRCRGAEMDAEWWCIALSIDLSVLSARVEGPRVTSVVQ